MKIIRLKGSSERFGRRERGAPSGAWLVPIALVASGLIAQVNGPAAYATPSKPRLRAVSRRSRVLMRDGIVFNTPEPGHAGELYDNLFDITAIDSDDVWADGYYIKAPKHENRWQTLIEHYTGGKVEVVPAPIRHRTTSSIPWPQYRQPICGRWGLPQISRVHEHTLTEHWNGPSGASFRVPGPDCSTRSPGAPPTTCGPGDSAMWITAQSRSRTSSSTGTERSGDSRRVPNQAPIPTAQRRISVVAPNNVWAVGQADLTENHSSRLQSTGTEPIGRRRSSRERGGHSLADISSAGSDDLWTAGSYEKIEPQSWRGHLHTDRALGRQTLVDSLESEPRRRLPPKRRCGGVGK